MTCVEYVFNIELSIITRHHRMLKDVASRPNPVVQPGLITPLGF